MKSTDASKLLALYLPVQETPEVAGSSHFWPNPNIRVTKAVLHNCRSILIHEVSAV